MKNILIPTDFSQEADRAFNIALQLARKFNAKLHLLHAVELPRDWKYFLENDITDKTAQLKDKLLTLQKTAEDEDLKATTFLGYESVRDEVNVYSRENNIDLIVVGSKGASGVKELLIGSNTEQIIRRAKCPVLVVKEDILLEQINKILFPTDLSPAQKPVAEVVKLWADKLNAKVCIVKLNTHYKWVDSHKFIEEIESFANEYQIKDFEARTYDAEYIEDGIIESSRQVKANLIIMGTHHRTGIAHIIAGSVAEDVANHATGLILTVAL